MTHDGEMILRAGVFYDGSLDEPRRNVDIVIGSGCIRDVRAASGNADRESACVTPGLVNAHAHLEFSGEPDTMTVVQTLPPMDRMLRAVENARKSLKAGVTSIRDLGASENISIELREAIARGGVPGPRIRAAGRVLCMTGGHGWPIGRAIDGPWDARKGVREQRLAGADCIKLIATGGVLTKGAVPGLAQLTPEEMSAACEEAHRHGLRVGAHAIGTQGIKDALRSGVD
ncbi:MAG TPA: amidohydrolase family protein, partial [Candidatus Baltobacteraceae bacterium]|nr:amidohydrolase family protein [Candidatus Baltobacteraceae bacterium]